MKTYIYIKNGSDKRGFNVNIRVYRMKNNVPKFIGNADWHTASWPGAYGASVRIISEVDGYKTDRGMYKFVRKDIQIIEV